MVTKTVVAAMVSVTVTAEQSEPPLDESELPEEPLLPESEESPEVADESEPVAPAETAETVRVLVEVSVPEMVVVTPSSPDDPESSEELSDPVELESEPLELEEPVASEPTAATVAVTYSVNSSVAVLVERMVVVTTVFELPVPRV